MVDGWPRRTAPEKKRRAFVVQFAVCADCGASQIDAWRERLLPITAGALAAVRARKAWPLRVEHERGL